MVSEGKEHSDRGLVGSTLVAGSRTFPASGRPTGYSHKLYWEVRLRLPAT